jgi:dipeptidyl aminopeptidase/acylaminoacyl peptidase
MQDGRIIVSRAESDGLLQISSLGGDPTEFMPTIAEQETDVHEPHALPDNRGVLFIRHGGGGPGIIELFADGERKTLLELLDQRLSSVSYAPSGHILFRRSPTNPGIWALPFSLEKLEVTGEPFLVVPAGQQCSVSDDGTLVYISGVGNTKRQFVWLNREGKAEPFGEEDADIGIWARIAPDGRRIVYTRTEGSNTDLWILDSVRGTTTRLTFDPAEEAWPEWTPDGTHIVHHVRTTTGGDGTSFRIVSRRADGTGEADTLAAGWAPVVTPDGKHVMFSTGTYGEADIGSVALSGGDASVVFRDESLQMSPTVSPTGEYVAYMSRESGGRSQIYLKRYPSWDGKWQVSIEGGDWPQWNSTGTRLYYLFGDDIFEVEVTGSTSPVLSRPVKLFTRSPAGRMFPGAGITFDVTGDGNRFLTRTNVTDESADQAVLVVQNWFSEFRNRE